MQNRIIQLLSSTGNFHAHTQPLFKELEILQFKDLLHLPIIIKERHKMTHNKACNSLINASKIIRLEEI